MAIVTGLNIPPALEDSFKKSVDVKDRRTKISIETKNVIWRKRNLKNFIADTPLDPVSVLWNNLSDADKALWNTAGSHCGMLGYRLFVQDTTYRIENNLAGVATPNNNHQYKVMVPGNVNIPILFLTSQFHYSSYYVKQYRSGSKKAYDWVEVSEVFVPPLKVEFDYYSDLVAQFPTAYLKIKVGFSGIKAGLPVDEDFEFDLGLETAWTRWSQDLSPDMDEINYYRVTIDGYLVLGDMYFDNFNMEHGGTNYAINPNCDKSAEIYYLKNNIYLVPWQSSVSGFPRKASSVYID